MRTISSTDLVEPVASPHVQQLVIGDGFLHLRLEVEDVRRNDNDGIEEPERDGTSDTVGYGDGGADVDPRLRLLERRRHRHEEGRGPSKPDEAHRANRQPEPARRDPGDEHQQHELG